MPPQVSPRDPQETVRLQVRVTPRAARNAVATRPDGSLAVRVTAPPVDSAANEAVIELLAGHFGVAKRDVTVVRGAASRHKIVDVLRPRVSSTPPR